MKLYTPKPQDPTKPWCGPISIANALWLYGLRPMMSEVIMACGANEEGTDEPGIVRAMKWAGFHAIVRDVRKNDHRSRKRLFAWLTKQTSLGRIVVCGINGNYDRGHWILILGVSAKGVLVWDPHDAGPKLVTRKNLHRAWWNVSDAKLAITEPSNIWLAAMSPRRVEPKRVVELRRRLLFPIQGVLPTEKDLPKETT